MASQQAYQAYAQQAKGTLIPGQTIAVNKYTVQVERYLSQGGFAHVYLVRTPAPVYNTTHHVLKRIAVANEAMLSEVKKEVDVMRVLRGHPNIVHLIDAAWHRLPNGTYEVFILMEYCPGGGIIDMMNRRLRERLIEAEILQIFVDVCEGVAFMHNSRPPLLHRDLKVENILQSSPTSYKLCDFGSATTVGRPPTNTAEIRALEADLGRHTTMQYRAPEMIDLYSKRPVDEKSDIWALGVLLYKLCYYTTPFEEHGSLAILNVQYRIPPYPVYSNQMNMLIASMLREHGTQRPTIFEMLKHVHHLRGSKSLFNYQLPAPQQPLMPRQPQLPQIAPKPGAVGPIQATHPNPSRQVASGLRSAPVTSVSPQNQGVQAREKVLEAIAPMRRGRPTTHAKEGSSSRQPSPAKASSIPPQRAPSPLPKASLKEPEQNWLDKEEASWKTTQSDARERANALFDEAWSVSGTTLATNRSPDAKSAAGFGDDFAEKLWRSSNPNDSVSPPKVSPKPTPPAQSDSSAFKPHSHTGSEAMKRDRDKDAFEGLGLMTSIGKPAPTLAEARKLRTGLATMSSQYGSYKSPDTSLKPSSNAGATRPTPSPRPSYLGPTTGAMQSMSRSPTPNTEAWKNPSSTTTTPMTSPSAAKDGPAESRFPSLEELDAQFTPQSLYPAATRVSEPSRSNRPTPSSTSAVASPGPTLPPRPNNLNGAAKEQGTGNTRPSRFHNPPASQATLDSLEKKFEAKGDWKLPSARTGDTKSESLGQRSGSTTMRFAMESLDATSRAAPRSPSKQSLTDKSNAVMLSSKQRKPSPQHDWLTGDDDAISTSLPKTTTGPVVRDAPLKRRSVIVQSDFKLQSPAAAQYDTGPLVEAKALDPAEDESPTVSRFTKNFPPIDTASANESAHHNEPLTDNWSPVATKHTISRDPVPASRPLASDKKTSKDLDDVSSAEEDEPEDLGSLTNKPKPSTRMKHKSRQSSVHELVDLWGGGPAKEKGYDASPSRPSFDKPKPKPRPSSLMPPARSPSVRSVSGGSPGISPGRRAPSPQPISPAPSQEPMAQSPPPLTSPSSSTGRSRPQSMFLFPSKTTDNNGATSLSPPPEELPSPRPARRQNSITNVVQRYEAFGGKVITPQQVQAAPVTRSISGQRADAPPSQNEVGRVKVLPVPDNKIERRPSKDEFRPVRIGGEPRTRTTSTTTAPLRNRANSTSRTPLDIPISGAVKPSRVSPVGRNKDLPPSPRKSAFTTPGRPLGAGGGSGRHEANSSISFPPKRKPTLAADDAASLNSTTSSSSNADSRNRPSSPEKPYQGVGKLIDQWQRKSGEAEAAGRPIKRTLVSGHRP